MKIYVDKCSPNNFDLETFLSKHLDYTTHFITEYTSPEGVFTYEKNILYKEEYTDKQIETKTLGDHTLIIDNSTTTRTPWYQLPCEHNKEILYKYVVELNNIQFVIYCVKSGNKSIPVDTYFQACDSKLIDVQETADELNVFLSSFI